MCNIAQSMIIDRFTADFYYMIYLLLASIFTAGLFVCFRLFAVFKVPTFQAIIVNYYTCVALGIFFSPPGSFRPDTFFNTPYFLFSLVLGLLFVSTFYLIGYTAREVSMTLSSLANKMSMVIPMVAAVFLAGIPSRPLDAIQIVGLVLTLFSIVFSALSGGGADANGTNAKTSAIKALLPIVVFVMSGLVDTGINLGNYLYLQGGNKNGFIISVFFFAGSFGLLVAVIKKMPWNIRAVLGGVVLGVVNYFSLFLLLMTLDVFHNDAVFVFPAVNILTILFAGSISILVFKEKLGLFKRLSLLLAFLAITCLSYKDLLP